MAKPVSNHTHPKIIEITFSFPEFVPASKISVNFIYSFFEIQSISEFHNQSGYAYFWQCPPKKFLINFYFMWICINMQKIRLFYWFPLEIWLIKKSCNLFGWEQSGPYLRNKTFPKYGICAGIQQIIYVFIIKQIQ